VKVRKAQPDDIPALAGIAARSYAGAFAGILEADVLAGRDPAFFADRFAASLDRMLLAEKGGAPLGFSLVTNGHLDMLFVDPAAQGTGAGSALMDVCEGEGIRTLECFAANAPARAFYERRGWRLREAYERDFAGALRSFVLYERP
jgi:putative acetyltransferase